MDGLSAASSIFATIDISVKVINFCSDYIKTVKGAKDSIERLRTQISIVRDVLQAVGALIESQPDKLLTLQHLSETLREVDSELEKLKSKLEPSKGRQAIRKFGLHALKWPFTSKEVDEVIERLEKQKSTLNIAIGAENL
jgi:hypothetical protein